MTTIHPSTLDEARSYGGEYRAGGTDVEARRRLGLSSPVTVDLRRIEGLRGIDVGADGVRIGALTRITEVALALADSHPAIALTAGSLANPHTRSAGTIGGNLLQATRCWYFRTGQVECFKTGDDGCPAREGVHHFGNVFDTSSCIAPHPSSIAMALLAHDAVVTVDPGGEMPVAGLYSDDPSSEHTLTDGQILTSVLVGPAVDGERAAYWRANQRLLAEWPLVEAVCRLSVDGDSITSAAVAVGGVAPAPLRLEAVEEALIGRPATQDTISAAAALASDGSRPAPQAAFKLDMLRGTVSEVLERALSGEVHAEASVHERAL